MEITFKGVTAADLVKECENFIAEFSAPKNKEAKGIDSVQSLEKAKLKVVGEKRKPGRPAKNSLQSETTSEKNWCGQQGSNLRPATAQQGITQPPASTAVEPTVKKPAAPVTPPKITDLFDEPAQVETPQVSKEMLTEAIQKLCEKENTNSGNDVAGITKVRAIYAQFGVKRLGELPEAKYGELYSLLEQSL